MIAYLFVRDEGGDVKRLDGVKEGRKEGRKEGWMDERKV